MADEVAPDGGSEKIGEYVRIYRRGAAWYANYQFNKKQHRESLGTANKKEARRRAAQIDVKITARPSKAFLPANELRSILRKLAYNVIVSLASIGVFFGRTRALVACSKS